MLKLLNTDAGGNTNMMVSDMNRYINTMLVNISSKQRRKVIRGFKKKKSDSIKQRKVLHMWVWWFLRMYMHCCHCFYGVFHIYILTKITEFASSSHCSFLNFASFPFKLSGNVQHYSIYKLNLKSLDSVLPGSEGRSIFVQCFTLFG